MRTLARTAIAMLLGGWIGLAGRPSSAPNVNGFTDSLVTSGLVNPTSLAFLPDGRILVCEEGGRLLLVNADQTNTSILTTFTTALCPDQETGLLGVAVDPNFNANGFVYFYLTKQEVLDPCDPAGRVNEVVRYTMGPGDTINLGSKLVLLTDIRTDLGFHNGGGLAIGKDETLYIGTGDTGTGDFGGGGPGTSVNPYAQDLSALEGKILRINLDGTIPFDNPFLDSPPARPEIYVLGFRNPYRLTADRVNGPIFVADVGEDDVEEIDVLKKGGNYAWPRMEGKLPVNGKKPGDVAPAFAYSHNDADSLGSAISAIAISPRTFANYPNRLFFGDYMSSNIYALAMKPGNKGIVGKPVLFASDCGGPVDIQFGPNPAGAPGVSLYYVAFDFGEIRRITPDTSNAEQFVTGKSLLLRSSPKKSISLQSNDVIDVGSVGDMPTAIGASLRVRGTGFDNSYPLPPMLWKTIGPLPDGVTGFTYGDPKKLVGPIQSVTVRKGKQIRVAGAGDMLGHVIGMTDPSPIHIDFFLGTKKFCMSFGGTTTFHPGKDVSAKNAPAPVVCPP